MISTLFAHSAATILLGAAPTAPLADIFVDVTDANCATGTGIAGSPVCSIGAAITLAAPGDIIRIAPGTYFENVIVGFDLDLIGTGGATVTTVDGGGLGSVVTIPAAVTVTIDGLTLTNGTAVDGGGISVAGDLTLSGSRVVGNRATGGGGGIGSYATGARVTIVDTLVSDNSAQAGSGGGVHVEGGTCTLLSSTVSNNRALNFGGGIDFEGIDPTTDLFTITNTTVSGNRVTGAFGGGVEHRGGFMMMCNSTISGNSSDLTGGGIETYNAGFSIVNSTISGNTSYYGGGMFDQGTVLPKSISGSTITGNTGGYPYGASGVYVATSTGPSVSNTIIADNTFANTNYAGDTYGFFDSLGFNLIGESGGYGFTNGVLSDQVGTPAAPIDPLLGPLQDNGGPTQTHALLPGSPALDGGNPMTFEATDQRGIGRPQGTSSDIGSFEEGSVGICNGDGGDGLDCTPCPCGNDQPPGTLGGCVNSTGVGALMTSFGTNSVAAADLRFEARYLPANSAALLVSGSALAPTNALSPCFGLGSGIQSPTLDGLRCVVQGLLKHGIRPANADGEIGVTTNAWGTPSGFFNFGAFMIGETRYFQVTYRDDLAAMCQTGLNTTQAAGITFTP